MLNTDKAWEKWGRQDPYFGVLANERYSASNIAGHRDEFFATGSEFVATILASYHRHFGCMVRNRALDHGCGVGRVTLPLAREFSKVVAIDVSPSMLSEARANAATAGVENVAFAVADDMLSGASGKFDFVNSLMVLQHIPVRRGLPILFRLVDKVRPGGAFHLHLSCRTDGPGSRFVYWASANVPGVKVVQNVQSKRPWNAPAMQMNNYPMGRVFAGLAARGIGEFLVFAERHAKFVTCGLIGKTPI